MIDLRLDLFPLEIGEGGDLDFAVEVADVADDGIVLHLVHVLTGDDIDVAVVVTKMSPNLQASSIVTTW